ncbi:MAG: hypothetical protein DRI65_04305 [Chloroflexota bacterium]|nr:MAG: hypothetical protein DRI65_04305 [Chloroflexota bacterium]
MIRLIDFSGNSCIFPKNNQKNMETEFGQGILEYALIFSFVVVLLVVLLYFFGDRVEYIYQSILDHLNF